MTIDITEIIQALLYLAGVIISALVIPWLKNKLTDSQISQLEKWIDIAVKAAEQLYDSAQGEEKKQYVLDFLEKKGYTVVTEEIDNTVEAKVLELHRQLKA